MPRGVTFTYNANVTYLEQLHIFNTTQLEHGIKFIDNDINKRETITWNIAIITFCSRYDSAPLTTIRPFEYMFCKNQSEYCALTSNFDLDFSDCYLVEMELEYEETYAPIAGFFVHARQIVVLDQNLVPVWVGIQPASPVVF